MLDVPAHQTIYRFDQQLLLILDLDDEDDQQAPMLHIRRAAAGGLFDRLTDHYDRYWEHSAQPINPDLDVYADSDEYDEDERPEAGLAPDQQPAHADQATPSGSGATRPPRRWPRRPT